jgi:hypothetical protein
LGYDNEGRLTSWQNAPSSPTTTDGVGFVVLGDGTGRLPLALPPVLAADLRSVLRDARYLVAVGRLERIRWYRSLWAFTLTQTEPMIALAVAYG